MSLFILKGGEKQKERGSVEEEVASLVSHLNVKVTFRIQVSRKWGLETDMSEVIQAGELAARIPQEFLPQKRVHTPFVK